MAIHLTHLLHPELSQPVVIPDGGNSGQRIPVVVGEKVFFDPKGFTIELLEDLNNLHPAVAFTGGGQQPVVVSLWGHSSPQGHALSKLVYSIDAFVDSSAPHLVLFGGGTRLCLEKNGGIYLPEVWIAETSDFQHAKLFASDAQPPSLIPKAVIETGAFYETFDVLTSCNKDDVTLSRGPTGGVVWRAMGYYKAGITNVLLIDVHKRRSFLVKANGSVQLLEWDEAIELEVLPGYRVVMADLCKEERLGKACEGSNIEPEISCDAIGAIFKRQNEEGETCKNDAEPVSKLVGRLDRSVQGADTEVDCLD